MGPSREDHARGIGDELDSSCGEVKEGDTQKLLDKY